MASYKDYNFYTDNPSGKWGTNKLIATLPNNPSQAGFIFSYNGGCYDHSLTYCEIKCRVRLASPIYGYKKIPLNQIRFIPGITASFFSKVMSYLDIKDWKSADSTEGLSINFPEKSTYELLSQFNNGKHLNGDTAKPLEKIGNLTGESYLNLDWLESNKLLRKSKISGSSFFITPDGIKFISNVNNGVIKLNEKGSKLKEVEKTKKNISEELVLTPVKEIPQAIIAEDDLPDYYWDEDEPENNDEN